MPKKKEDITPLIGQRFGEWLLLGDAGMSDKGGQRLVNARCLSCGDDFVRFLNAFKSGRSKCCENCSVTSRTNISELIGQRFGDWLILNEVDLELRPSRGRRWMQVRCLCCGNDFVRQLSSIKSGRSSRCRPCNMRRPEVRQAAAEAQHQRRGPRPHLRKPIEVGEQIGPYVVLGEASDRVSNGKIRRRVRACHQRTGREISAPLSELKSRARRAAS